MRVTTLLNKLLNLPGLWVRGVEITDTTLVIRVRRRFQRLSCSACGTKVRGRFHETTRRWRHLGIWGLDTYIEGPIRRLRCPTCKKVRTELVPWARHRSSFTRPFEEAVGYLAQKLDHTAVASLTGISWPTVGSIAERLVCELLHEERFDSLRRIGVDEISYRRHHKYLTVVIDHDRQRVIWAGEGRSSATLLEFFALLGPERRRVIELVSIDMAAGYLKAIREALPAADVVFDRFHVARLAQDAVDQVRRDLMRQLPRNDRRPIKKTRWVLLRRPDHLRPYEHQRLAEIRRFSRPLYRAWELKETFLAIFECNCPRQARDLLHRWLSWAARCRLYPFVRLGRTIRKHLDGVLAFIEHNLTNARLEGMNNKIRLLSHRAYGFHSAEPLIATIYLCCSKITLPELQLI